MSIQPKTDTEIKVDSIDEKTAAAKITMKKRVLVDEIGERTGSARTSAIHGLKVDTIAELTGAARTTLLNGIKTDVIAEYTGSAKVSLPNGIKVDTIAEYTGAAGVTFGHKIKMGANQITGLAAGSLYDDAPNLRQVQAGALNYIGATGGAANAYTGSLSPAIAAYAAGENAIIIPNFENTGASTINLNGVGAANIKIGGAGPVPVGHFNQACHYHLFRDGTNFYVMGSSEPRVFSRSAFTTVAASTIVETILCQIEIPAGILGLYRCLRATMFGVVLNNTGSSRIFRFRLKVGPSGGAATTYLDTGASDLSLATSVSSRPFVVECWIQGMRDTSINDITGRLQMGDLTYGGTTWANCATLDFTKWAMSFGANHLNNDFTVARTLYLTVEHSSNSASMSSACTYHTAEYL